MLLHPAIARVVSLLMHELGNSSETTLHRFPDQQIHSQIGSVRWSIFLVSPSGIPLLKIKSGGKCPPPALMQHKTVMCWCIPCANAWQCLLKEYRSYIKVIYLIGFLYPTVTPQSGMQNIKVVSDDAWCGICHSPMVD